MATLPIEVRGLTAEFWLFGFAPTVYTNNPYIGPAAVFVIHNCFNYLALHGRDVTTADEHTESAYTLTVHSICVLLGVFCGLAFTYATDFVRVLDLRFFYSDPQRHTSTNGYMSVARGDAQRSLFNTRSSDGYEGAPWRSKPYAWSYISYYLALPAIYASILFFMDWFTNLGPRSISSTTSYAIGGVLLAFGVVALLSLIVSVCVSAPGARIPDGHDKSDELNLKYALLFFLFVGAAPLLFDFTSSVALGWRYAIFLATLFVVLLATAAASRNDRYGGSVSTRRTYLTFGLLWLVVSSVYACSAFLETLDDQFIWVAAWTAGWFVVFVAAGAVRRCASAREQNLREQTEATAEYMRTEAHDEVDRYDASREALVNRSEMAADELATAFDSIDFSPTADSSLRRRNTSGAAKSAQETSAPRSNDAAVRLRSMIRESSSTSRGKSKLKAVVASR